MRLSEQKNKEGKMEIAVEFETPNAIQITESGISMKYNTNGPHGMVLGKLLPYTYARAAMNMGMVDIKITPHDEESSRMLSERVRGLYVRIKAEEEKEANDLLRKQVLADLTRYPPDDYPDAINVKVDGVPCEIDHEGVARCPFCHYPVKTSKNILSVLKNAVMKPLNTTPYEKKTQFICHHCRETYDLKVVIPDPAPLIARYKNL